MVGWLLDVLRATWEILKDASVFLLLGFLFAGMLAVLVPAALLTRLAGSSKVKSVLWASTLGARLPLCLCGVLPTALGLRKQGATVTFVVAPPETGIDSISSTYALTDPTMTIFRPIAGIVTTIAAGLATNFFGASRPGMRSAHAAHGEALEADEGSRQACDRIHRHDHDHGHNHLHDHGSSQQPGGPKSVNSAIDAMRPVIRYGFVELFDDIPPPSSRCMNPIFADFVTKVSDSASEIRALRSAVRPLAPLSCEQRTRCSGRGAAEHPYR